MRKASRLFEILQILRTAKRPVTAEKLAEALEVGPRSIYRDIAALQAMRLPIEGERGLGYILRPGFDLPPLMFTVDELETIVLGLALLDLRADPQTQAQSARVRSKIATAVPAPLRETFESQSLYAWGGDSIARPSVDLAMLRRAIRDERKVRIAYRDEQERETERVIWPLALIYYPRTTTLTTWCAMRASIRSFRSDRIVSAQELDEFFSGEGDRLRQMWVASWAAP